MSQIKAYFPLSLMILFFISCENTVKRLSVEEERWSSVFESNSNYSLNTYLNEYPHTLHYDSAMSLMRQTSDEWMGGVCHKNWNSIIQIDKDSVFIGYSTIHINDLDSALYRILQENWSTRDFVDNTGQNNTYSFSIFLLHPKDSIALDQNILIQSKLAIDLYNDSLIHAWYPNGLRTELENTDFEKYTRNRIIFINHKAIKPKFSFPQPSK